MARWFIIFVACVFIPVFCDYIIDVDDILSSNYMPMSLLLLENPENADRNFVNNTDELKSQNIRGKFDDALATMGFHRKMMNEYLCRNFVAEQIVADMTLTRIKRRLGKQPDKNVENKSETSARELTTNLIEDEGSSSYKNWLSKSATLEDIYRHYESTNKRREGEEDENGEEDDYDKEAAGYSYQKHGLYDHSAGSTAYHLPTYPAIHGSGHNLYGSTLGSFGSTHGAYGGNLHQQVHGHYEEPAVYHPPVEYEHPKYHGEYEHKGKDLYALYDIASTALAYLSFGMFLIQLIMCISLSLSPTTTTMAMMMTGTGGGMKAVDNNKEGATENFDDLKISESHHDVVTHYDDTGEEKPHFQEYHDSGTGVGDGIVGEEIVGAGSDFDDNGGEGTGVGDDEGIYGSMGHGGGSTGDGGNRDPTGDDSTGTGTGMDAGGMEGLEDSPYRVKRGLPILEKSINQETNELARRIVKSMEAAMVVGQDGGNCLRKILCENNSYSRGLKDRNKIWIPVWSLGMSWLSGKLVKGIPASTAVLDSLKASILGLGNANCDVIYQECDLKSERAKRRRRRKKRSTF